jgi:hypothetical protein
LAFDRGWPALVFQGRHAGVAKAEPALRTAGTRARREPAAARAPGLAAALSIVPSMTGLRLRRLKRPIDVTIAAVEIASFVFPVVSTPSAPFANARATHRLGRAAIRYYSRTPAAGAAAATVVLPDQPPCVDAGGSSHWWCAAKPPRRQVAARRESGEADLLREEAARCQPDRSTTTCRTGGPKRSSTTHQGRSE